MKTCCLAQHCEKFAFRIVNQGHGYSPVAWFTIRRLLCVLDDQFTLDGHIITSHSVFGSAVEIT